MKIDLDRALVQPDGKSPIPMGRPEPGMTPEEVDAANAATTLKTVVMNALLTQFPNDAATNGLAYRLYTLARRCADGGVVDIETLDVGILDQRIAAISNPWIYGQAVDALNGREEPVDRPLETPPPPPERSAPR